MISPEILRRYPFFGALSDEQLKSMAMIAEETKIPKGTVICEEGKQADAFYLLVAGGISLFYISDDEFHPEYRKELFVGEINPGEVFAISALIEPYFYTATVRADKDCQLVKFETKALNDLLKQDPMLNCLLMEKIAKVLIERLAFSRVQLAAAWTK